VVLGHRPAVEITEEAGVGAGQGEEGGGAEGLETVVMRESEHRKTRTKLAGGTTIGKEDMTGRWPKPVHLNA
jgi:hypothetical protein